MGKEFVEYHREDGRIPYSASTLCFCLTQYVKDYIATERKIISKIDKKIRDAVLVDAINYLGMNGGIDFALHTQNLHDDRIEKEYVDPQCILTVLFNHYSSYIFNEGIVESVLRNNHMNECRKEFDVNEGIIVLLDFINYIADRNEYDRKFTIKDLYEKAQKQNHDKELNELKSFLERVNGYSERLNNGENIDSIFSEVAKQYDLKNISEKGIYYYTDKIKKRLGRSQMFSWDKNAVEKEIYAIAYAYGKSTLNTKQKPQTEIIRKKLREMKTKK
jgi:hypothetical protein